MDETLDAAPCILPAAFLFDLGDALDGYDFVSYAIGYEGAIYVLAVTAPADYREENEHGTSFAKLYTNTRHDFVVVRWFDGQITRVAIRHQTWNYHFVQPLPDDELLLVCARSQYRGPNDFDLNGRVFTTSGTLVREFLLGDGLAAVQTTASSMIWTGYTDEGIYGNFGWGRVPVKRSRYARATMREFVYIRTRQYGKVVGEGGLVLWDRLGNRVTDYPRIPTSDNVDSIFQRLAHEGNFYPHNGKPIIDALYAMNVTANEEAWLYTYMTFTLARVRGDVLDNLWECPVHGAQIFAVHEGDVLFGGGYHEREVYRLFTLREDGTMQHRTTYRIAFDGVDPFQDDPRVRTGTNARGSSLYFRRGTRFYHVDVRDALNAR